MFGTFNFDNQTHRLSQIVQNAGIDDNKTFLNVYIKNEKKQKNNIPLRSTINTLIATHDVSPLVP